MTVIAQVALTPIGTSSTSISSFIAEAIKSLKELKVKHMLTPMGTIIEANNLKELFEAIEKCHEALFKAGAKRVYAVVLIDDRRDVERTMLDKVKSVEEKLSKQA